VADNQLDTLNCFDRTPTYCMTDVHRVTAHRLCICVDAYIMRRAVKRLYRRNMLYTSMSVLSVGPNVRWPRRMLPPGDPR